MIAMVVIIASINETVVVVVVSSSIIIVVVRRRAQPAREPLERLGRRQSHRHGQPGDAPLS